MPGGVRTENEMAIILKADNLEKIYRIGKVDVPAIQSPVISVDKANVKAALFDSGYYKTSDYTGL